MWSASRRPVRALDSPSNRIVLIRPDHFGDFLMLGPAIDFARSTATNHEIVVLTGPWNAEVARHIAPDVQLATFPFPGFDRSSTERSLTAPYRQIMDCASVLRDLNPAMVVLMRDDHWWGGWMSREAGVPLRVGYDDNRTAQFLTHPCTLPTTHYVAQNLELIRRSLSILGYDTQSVRFDPDSNPLSWPVDDVAKLEALRLREAADVDERYVILHPGTGADVKLWAEERWATVIDSIRARTNLPVILTGSPGEREMCTRIATKSRSEVTNLAGETSLKTLGELMRDSSLVLGVDSGPLHLAVSVDTPSIHLYGPSDGVRYGPWGNETRHKVISAGLICPACGDLSATRKAGCGCMMAIPAERVSATAIEMLHHVG